MPVELVSMRSSRRGKKILCGNHMILNTLAPSAGMESKSLTTPARFDVKIKVSPIFRRDFPHINFSPILKGHFRGHGAAGKKTFSFSFFTFPLLLSFASSVPLVMADTRAQRKRRALASVPHDPGEFEIYWMGSDTARDLALREDAMAFSLGWGTTGVLLRRGTASMIGYCRLSDEPASTTELASMEFKRCGVLIWSFYINEPLQGQGYGTLFIDKLMEQHRRIGVESMTLEGRRFWESVRRRYGAYRFVFFDEI